MPMLAIGVIYFVVVSAAMLVVFVRLAEERIDIPSDESPFSGGSVIWQFNVLKPSNYTEKGRRLLRWLYAGYFAMVAGMVVFGVFVAATL